MSVLVRSLLVYNGLTTLLPVLIREVRLPRSTTDQSQLKTAARHNEIRRRTLICCLYTTETTTMGCGMSTECQEDDKEKKAYLDYYPYTTKATMSSGISNVDYKGGEEDVSVFCANVPVTSAVSSDADLNHSP